MRTTVGLAAGMGVAVAAMAGPTGTVSWSAAVRATAPEFRHGGVGHAVAGYADLEHAVAGYAELGHAVAGPAVGNVGAVLAADDADAVGAGAAPWVWPTGSRVVVRPWEAPADDYSAGHRGVDVPAPIGTPVVAVADGTVSFAGAVAGRSVVSVDHGGGLVSTLDSVSPAVRTGDAVSQGGVVGRVAVGHCPATDPCVHLGARLDDRYVDPTPYLPAAAWPVLLPESDWPG
ncbi:M23 family metallopeptidase [Curtobacterium luteum]|uniref:M23 family metallopeptidase n=1 Tax=Curtobacterium luteum TaxID=33881 RepID=UPI000AEE4D9D|nr:M23 family metallopeptidase [Curtobacterium luteum]